jgi:PAS domain-containing protein
MVQVRLSPEMSSRGVKNRGHRWSRSQEARLPARAQDLSLGDFFERVRDAVFVVEANTGRVVLWNAAATEFFGYLQSKALDPHIEALVPELLEARYPAHEGRFRSAFDNAPIGVAIVDLEGRFVRVNRSLCEMLGYPEKVLLATAFLKITTQTTST